MVTRTDHTPPLPNLCPLCGRANECAMQIEQATGIRQPPCWCTGATFGAELLARVPEEARNRACICARCAALPVDVPSEP
jgi:hypothetical protein